jgi:SAM-dependent methyltransferase
VGKIRLADLGLAPGGLVLDVGCSIGANARPLAALGYRTVGVDVDRSLVWRFRMLARRDGLPPGRAAALVADGACLPFASGCFDAVILMEVLEHTREPERVLRELSRVLRPGGTLCLSVPEERLERIFRKLHPRWVECSAHIQVFPREGLLDMVRRAGFACLRLTGEGSEWTLFWLLFSLLRTPFDHTGTPTARRSLVRIYWKVWRGLDFVGIMKLVHLAGDHLFPKSVYVYAVKCLSPEAVGGNKKDTEDGQGGSLRG